MSLRGLQNTVAPYNNTTETVMTLLTFEQFTFNPLTLELREQGTNIKLRPKTAELLRELILNRDDVISKRQLIQRIWHTEHVTDQSVFQAISELRSQLAPLVAIRTFPNRGYQWVLPTVEAPSHHRRGRLALAASVLVAVMALVSMNSAVTERPSTAGDVDTGLTEPDRGAVPVNAQGLPAMTVFSEGASALQRGDTDEALKWLHLSVAERPDFVEASLLLAEAYLLAGDALQARHRADNVMSAPGSSANAYATIAAMDLISRADQQLGQMNSALEWATRAADRANSNGYECTAADLHDRVLALVQDHDYSTAQLASPVFASDFARRMLRTAFAGRDSDTVDGAVAQSPLPFEHGSAGAASLMEGLLGATDAGARPAHCARYRTGPSGQLVPEGKAPLSLAQAISRHIDLKPLI